VTAFHGIISFNFTLIHLPRELSNQRTTTEVTLTHSTSSIEVFQLKSERRDAEKY